MTFQFGWHFSIADIYNATTRGKNLNLVRFQTNFSATNLQEYKECILQQLYPIAQQGLGLLVQDKGNQHPSIREDGEQLFRLLHTVVCLELVASEIS